jgi:galactokinase
VEVRAPGRVNLIGEHTDYSDGWCLPLAIDRECRIRHVLHTERVVRARSAELPGTVEVPLDGAPAPDSPRWGRFVAGAIEVVRGLGHEVAGADLAVHSTVPAGAGLSSSTALSVALVLALLPPDAPEHADRDLLARLALAAEVAATGVPGGLLDQMASLYGRAGHALLLDCRALTVEPVPVPPELAILVVHSGIARELADSEYAARRAACEAAAARIGVPALRDAAAAEVADDPIARHVVAENARVLACATALAAGELATVGEILLAGHASLRDDFAVSLPELDALVEIFVEHGAYGARLTGAGFGGCVVGLAPAARADECLAATLAGYAARTGRTPTGFRATPVDGAGVAT